MGLLKDTKEALTEMQLHPAMRARVEWAEQKHSWEAERTAPLERRKDNARDARIDALRAIAALSVLAIHTQNAWYLSNYGDRLRMSDTWLGLASSPLTLGFLGLNLFFILSGLCIHAWYLGMQERGATFSYGKYMKRRFWRIYPAYAAAIAFALGCLAVAEWIHFKQGFAGSSNAAHWIEQTLRYLTFTHTLSVETFGGYNAPLYTMAIEMHFYLAYPAVLYSFRRIGAVKTLALSILFSGFLTILVLASRNPVLHRLVLDSILVRWPEWIAGCMIAELWFRFRRGEQLRLSGPWVFAAAAVCFLAALWFQIATNVALNVLWSASIALLLPAYLMRLQEPQGWERMLAGVGLFSYSIYLLHWPLLRLAALLFPPERESLATHALIFGVVALATVLLARGFYALFEQPFLSARARA